MKDKKKKLLIFLLSAACVTAGAFGIAGCKDKKDKEETDPKKQAYDAYVLSVGSNALSYDDWLLLIQQDIKPGVRSKFIASTKIEANGELVLTYSDSSTWTAGKVSGDLVITYYNDTTKTVTIPSSSTAKKAVKGDFDGEYAQYVQSAGEGALSYDDWSALIRQDMIDNQTSTGTVKSAYVSDRCELILTYDGDKTAAVGTLFDDWEITFANGASETVAMPKLFIVTAVDQHGDPVPDAWIQLSYYNPTTYSSVSVGNAKTDAHGKAYFAPFEIVSGYTYNARLSDAEDVNTETVIPVGYELALGVNQYDMAITSLSFDETRQLTFNFKYAPDSFANNEKQTINYKRIFEKVDVREVNEPATKQVDGGHYGYFIFTPYQRYTPTSSSESAASIASNENRALEAASGRYRITVTADSSKANAVLYHYTGSSAYMTCDSDTGIPTAINKISGSAPAGAANPSLYTGTNSIEINLYKEIARGENVFGVYVSESCNVTLTVERIGNSIEPPEINVVEVEVTSTILPNGWEKPAGKTLTEVPVDGSVTIVKGDDGYYHVGSKNGPTLLINLTKTLSRVGLCAIVDLPKQEVDEKEHIQLGEAAFIFVSAYDENEFITEKKDFNKVVNEFAKYVNTDGVYGVNDNLYDFLQYFGNSCMGVTDAVKECWWLLPCQYYA